VNVKFKTATDFRKSLEARLQTHAVKTGEDVQRLRRKIAFDRFLARIFHQDTSNFCLKGGYAMELRIAHARATKDIDLTCIRRAKNEDEPLSELIWSDLQALAEIDLNDYFAYQIGKAQIDLENAPYGGARYLVTCLMHGKIFTRFLLDVGADFLFDQVESIRGVNWLEFCGISAPTIHMISIEQQFAEKLHAYTLPRGGRVNSRTKDLIDMVLLLNMRPLKLAEMRRTIDKVFEKRATHPLPQKLEHPPVEWQTQFLIMAAECGLSLDLQASFNKISTFYNLIYTTEFKNWEFDKAGARN
jgi:predicted nucleotidyltransferase component of viral defense system